MTFKPVMRIEKVQSEVTSTDIEGGIIKDRKQERNETRTIFVPEEIYQEFLAAVENLDKEIVDFVIKPMAQEPEEPEE